MTGETWQPPGLEPRGVDREFRSASSAPIGDCEDRENDREFDHVPGREFDHAPGREVATARTGERRRRHLFATPVATAEDSEGEWDEDLSPRLSPRFVRDSPGSLEDQIEYARRGAYTIREDGWWRKANIGYAHLATIGLGACYLIGWAFFTRLSRCICSVAFLVSLFCALNQLPATAGLVPDQVDITYWIFGPLDVGGGE